MDEFKSKVYVLPDEKGRIMRCEGGYTMGNISDISQWVLIDEGFGDRYNLCQSNYFPGGLFTEDGLPRWKLVDGQPVERTADELEADRAALLPSEPMPTLESRVDTLEAESSETREALEMILAGVTE